MSIYGNYMAEILTEKCITIDGNDIGSIPNYIKKIYGKSWNNNFDKDTLENVIKSGKKDLQKEWIMYLKEYMSDETDKNIISRYTASINKLEKMELVLIANDGGGSEFGYDIKSKKIYFWDHDYAFIDSPITKSQFIKLMQSVREYTTESAAWDVKLHDDEETDQYYKTVKKDKGFLEKEFNKCSAEAFATFREFASKNRNSGSAYDREVLSDLEDFYNKNKKAPKVAKFELETDLVDFYYDAKGTNDMCLYFQDHVVKYLNENEKLKAKGYYFSSEDYIAIYIHMK